MSIIDTANEREFANNTGYLEGGGSEFRLHLHSLIDEVEKLRKDAERYRWLRDVGDATWAAMAARTKQGAAGIDAAIDAAIAAR